MPQRVAHEAGLAPGYSPSYDESSSSSLFPLPWPTPLAAIRKHTLQCDILSACEATHTSRFDFFFPWVANWTLDECSSEDGFRVRQVLNVHCGLLTPPSGASDGLVTTFNCHIDLMILRSPWVITSILILCLDPDQP